MFLSANSHVHASFLYHFQDTSNPVTLLPNGRWKHQPRFKLVSKKVSSCADKPLFQNKAVIYESIESDHLHVQTLKSLPCKTLDGEVVLVRFDSSILLNHLHSERQYGHNAVSTIKYLHGAGAKLLLVSGWSQSDECTSSNQSIAEHLSLVLQLRVFQHKISVSPIPTRIWDTTDIILLENLKNYKQELANCLKFAKRLTTGVDIFVNDTFSQTHRILASTVGVSRFCHMSLAGFNLEEELNHLRKVIKITKRPYIAIIGGGNFLEKSDALHFLTSKCDALLFVGKLALQIMHALGFSIPSMLVEHDALGEVLNLIKAASERKISLVIPKDLLCINPSKNELQTFPSSNIPTCWSPVDIGPATLEEISCLISDCQKILWIGPVGFDSFKHKTLEKSQLPLILKQAIRRGCDVIIVGTAAYCAASKTGGSCSGYTHIANASVVWEYLKGRPLPGVAALDKAYPFNIDWGAVFLDPKKPLFVDIGSGNGLFLFAMAKKWKHFNFLGLEMNKKLVRHCLDVVSSSQIMNGYFISTNATHTFRSIVSSYPGKLAMISIQCPNPDFNKLDNRWRMVQRVLIEAISDLLATNGQIFLQSDIEQVTAKMEEEFIMYGNDTLIVDSSHGSGWLEENPFGVRSDWEQHVLDRGVPMYRVMLRKIKDEANSKSIDPFVLGSIQTAV